jgi:GT2 family glycosyltransferase
VRRVAFDEVGGWPDAFFFGHEGIDLAWRMWDAGWELHYAADLVVRHPTTLPSRHALFFRLTARNRVWVARRNLPWPLVPVYLAAWTLLTQVRLARQPGDLRVWWRGFVEGWRTDPGPRRAMRWRTVAHLARLGQPPIF